MSDITVVLVSGKSQNGKDEFFKQAGRALGFTRVAFADKLKSTVQDLYNLSDEQMHGSLKDTPDTRYPNLIDSPTIKVCSSLGVGVRGVGPVTEMPNQDYTKFLTPRRILQQFGQDQRALNPDIWVNYVFNSAIKNLVKEGHSKFMITDLRFPNEAAKGLEWGQATGSKVFVTRVNRPGIVAASNPNDISETALDNYEHWNAIIDNSGTIDELKQRGIESLHHLLNTI